MIPKVLARAVDEHLLSPCVATHLRVESLLLELALPCEADLLLRILCGDDAGASHFVPIKLGAYLPSRLALRKVPLSNNPIEWLHALANSVRAMDAISIYRLRFVIGEITELKTSASAVRLLQQSDRALTAISSLSLEMKEELNWECLLIPTI
jgi:hypothetical protein